MALGMGCMELHAIYGLYLSDQPDIILYVGSWSMATLADRLWQHRKGQCRTTKKMAQKNGIQTSRLHMRVLRYWTSGIDRCPEAEIARQLQADGQCRWNGPYTWSPEENRRGRMTTKERHRSEGLNPKEFAQRCLNIRNQPREARIQGGLVGARVLKEKHEREGLTERELVQRRAAAAIGMPIGGFDAVTAVMANHKRWHTDRGLMQPECAFCAEE